MMGVVINNSLNLIQSEFKGVRMLIPSILAAVENVLASGKPLEGRNVVEISNFSQEFHPRFKF